MQISTLVAIFAGVAFAAPIFPFGHKKTHEVDKRDWWETAAKVVGTGLVSGMTGAMLKTKIEENKEREEMHQDELEEKAEAKKKKAAAKLKKQQAQVEGKTEELQGKKAVMLQEKKAQVQGATNAMKTEYERMMRISSHKHHNLPQQQNPPAYV